MKRWKTGSIPGKEVNEDKLKEQEKFKAEAAGEWFFCTDAAHFGHGSSLAPIWCFFRSFILTPSVESASTFWVLCNVVMYELVTVINYTCIDSSSAYQVVEQNGSGGI